MGHWSCQTDRWALGLGGVIEGHGGRCEGDGVGAVIALLLEDPLG